MRIVIYGSETDETPELAYETRGEMWVNVDTPDEEQFTHEEFLRNELAQAVNRVANYARS